MNGFPGAGVGAAGAAGAGQYDPNDPNVKRTIALMNATMESCFGKAAISGVMGFGMGGLFGMFMASMAYDTPFHTPGAAGAAPTPISSLPWRQQLKVGFKDMGSRSYSTAKNFGLVGLMFSGIECGIEGYRAKNDMFNGAAAGCLTGGILARSGGPAAVAGGCAAFAAFSTAIDAWMRQPKDDE
ncbi:mitochondrial import inner membrane translocase, subunit Tim17/22 [Daldinia caldariorum]|uniref:mitochondrial import inner membrane translocase, subunit Tim17/22 n=1 Tax=Daldinia caldariorum TaxID=326644 RepID=UPI00200849EC|nr:mitochondrial import inner membrane translocase, subunit Tim17/22 [Daldinia caldariorum]KAI1466288.1 mitochondrial import inner membrane translocase, subunit Tim17/22 [Daldinia caldariorum]